MATNNVFDTSFGSVNPSLVTLPGQHGRGARLTDSGVANFGGGGDGTTTPAKPFVVTAYRGTGWDTASSGNHTFKMLGPDGQHFHEHFTPAEVTSDTAFKAAVKKHFGEDAEVVLPQPQSMHDGPMLPWLTQGDPDTGFATFAGGGAPPEKNESGPHVCSSCYKLAGGRYGFKMTDPNGRSFPLELSGEDVGSQDAFEKAVRKKLGASVQVATPTPGTNGFNPPWAVPEASSLENAQFGDNQAAPWLATANAAVRRGQPLQAAVLEGVRGPYFASDPMHGGVAPGQRLAVLATTAGMMRRQTVLLSDADVASESAFLACMERAGYAIDPKSLKNRYDLPWLRNENKPGIPDARTVKDRRGGSVYAQTTAAFAAGVPEDVFQRAGEAVRDVVRQGGSEAEAHAAGHAILAHYHQGAGSANFSAGTGTDRATLDALLGQTELGRQALTYRRRRF
jgi:hypothetical protein